MSECPRRRRPSGTSTLQQPGEIVQPDCFFIGPLQGSKGSVWQYTAIDVTSGID